MKHIKEEFGVMVMKNGKAWGQTYADGHSTEYGWMNPTDAPVRNPKYCTLPTDVVHENSHYIKELQTATVEAVVRVTTVEVV